MKKILISILILFVCNLSYAQLGGSISEIKAKYNTKPFLSDRTSDGYFFLAYHDNIGDFYFNKNNKCFLKKS